MRCTYYPLIDCPNVKTDAMHKEIQCDTCVHFKKQVIKILKPVPVEKRLPEIKEGENYSLPVIVKYINHEINEFEGFAIGSVDTKNKWHVVINKSEIINDDFVDIVAWYEEVEITALFPNEDTMHNVAESASKGWLANKSCHLEGQFFLRNHIIKQLKK